MKRGVPTPRPRAQVAATTTTYNTARYRVWTNDTALKRHIDAIAAAYDGHWGPYVSLSPAETEDFFEMPPQPWDVRHRPDVVERQKLANGIREEKKILAGRSRAAPARRLY